MAHDHEVYMTLVEAAVELRDAAALTQYTPLLEELARRDGHKLYLGIAQRAWGVAQGLAGAYPEAEARLKEALVLFRELGTGWQIGRTLFEMGKIAQNRLDHAAACDYFEAALAEFEALGAMPDVQRTHLELETINA